MNLNDQSKKPQSRKQQLLWFIGLWVVGVVGNVLINRRMLYRNGVDNAFVVMATAFVGLAGAPSPVKTT
ncbi:MAG: hypothetical protein EOP49_29610, partial [Sphingobacteriales bacterium]